MQLYQWRLAAELHTTSPGRRQTVTASDLAWTLINLGILPGLEQARG